MANLSVEERLTTLEQELAQLKVQLKVRKLQDDVPWWRMRAGAFKDDPMYDEAMRLGREWRESQWPDYMDEEDGASEPSA